MNKEKAEDIKAVIRQNPFAILEAVTYSQKNHHTLQHIIFRAHIFHQVSEDYCVDYPQIIESENLKKLQQFAFMVYLNQGRDPLLNYQRTVNHLIMLLNLNVPMKTLLSLSPNEFMDEVLGLMPRQKNRLGVKLQERGDFIAYLLEKQPEELFEAMLLHPTRVEEVLLQGQMHHMIYPSLCKEYGKVVTAKNLEKLFRCAKDRVKYTLDGSLSLKKAVDDICCLLNHNVLLAKVLIMSGEEVEERILRYEKEDHDLALRAFQEMRDLKDLAEISGEEVEI